MRPKNNITLPTITTQPTKLPVTSNKNPYGERSLFDFSPDQKNIAFIEDVFEKYGHNYDRYYAVNVFNVESKREKSLLIDTYKISGFEWRNNDTIRVFLDAGTGIRAYRDISIQISKPLIFKDFVASSHKPETFWTPDEQYLQELQRKQLANQKYLELTSQ
ncbi:MAG: hypothetical protein Q8P73_05250 [bacterium]|nr:hypothetical protein [bacterium]